VYHYTRAAGKAPGPKDLAPGLTDIRQRPARPYEIPGKPAQLQGLDHVGQGAAGLVNRRRKKKPGQLAGFKGLQLQLLADQVQQGAGLFL
jgi:hypothetical protein